MAAGSLRPHIVRVMSANRERPLRTQEIYEAGAKTGVAGFAPRAKRDRNRVNRELSDLAAMVPESHSKPTPQLLARVGRGHYIFREPEFPMDLALMREYLEPEEVYEKRPPRGRRPRPGRERAAESVRVALFAVQRGICPGCGIYLPHHYLRFEVDHIVALADHGRTEEREFVQVLRLLENFSHQEIHHAVKDALRLGAISFDAVKHLLLCRLEGTPPRLDPDLYPYLPRVTVKTTRATDYMALLSGRAASATGPRCSSRIISRN